MPAFKLALSVFALLSGRPTYIPHPNTGIALSKPNKAFYKTEIFALMFSATPNFYNTHLNLYKRTRSHLTRRRPRHPDRQT